MNAQALSAVVGLLALAAALVWYALSGVEPRYLGTPRYQGRPVPVITADTPPIGDFAADFYVNEQNPFVPYNLRVEEMRGKGGPKGWKPTPPVQIAPPKPMAWPKAVAGSMDVPDVHGLVVGGDQQPMVLASVAGGEPSRLSPGDRIGRWTLKAIDVGNIARFADDAGHEYPVVVSPGEQEPPAPRAAPSGASADGVPGGTKPPGGERGGRGMDAPPGAKPPPDAPPRPHRPPKRGAPDAPK